MKTSRISEILENLIEGKQKSILIDGPWGVGKTYELNKFITKYEKSKRTKVIYISLFGKNSIDEIHTQIYSKIHPTINLINKSISLLSPAASLIPYAGETVKGGLDFILDVIEGKTDERKTQIKSKARSKKLKSYIILFDDLERKGNDLSFSSILGYINQLFLLRMKVVVVCNSKEIKEDNDFVDFKEKIFDREFIIDKANEEIIRSLFGDVNLDKEVIDLFNDNIRLASKSSLFYYEVRDFIIKHCSGDQFLKLENQNLLWYCSLIVSNFNTQIDFDFYKERMKKVLNFIRSDIEEYFNNKELCDKVEVIYHKDSDSGYQYSGKNDKVFSYKRAALICSLVEIYLFNDYSYLEDFLKIETNSSSGGESYFDKDDIFFLSEENKKEYIKNILAEIKQNSFKIDSKKFRVIEAIYSYKKFFPIEFNQDEFANILAEKISELDEELKELYFLDQISNDDFKDLCLKICDKIISIKLSQIKGKISTISIKDEKSFYDILQILKEKRIFHMKGNDSRILTDIEELFYKNNLFIPDLSGNINPSTWTIVHSIIDFLYDYGDRAKLNNFLDVKIKKSKSTTEKERYNVFVKEYFSKS